MAKKNLENATTEHFELVCYGNFWDITFQFPCAFCSDELKKTNKQQQANSKSKVKTLLCISFLVMIKEVRDKKLQRKTQDSSQQPLRFCLHDKVFSGNWVLSFLKSYKFKNNLCLHRNAVAPIARLQVGSVNTGILTKAPMCECPSIQKVALSRLSRVNGVLISSTNAEQVTLVSSESGGVRSKADSGKAPQNRWAQSWADVKGYGSGNHRKLTDDWPIQPTDSDCRHFLPMEITPNYYSSKT